MDETRFLELMRKRDRQGLSDAEVEELGRLVAERNGKPYSLGSIARERRRLRWDGAPSSE